MLGSKIAGATTKVAGEDDEDPILSAAEEL
jgi:hypothetical protein